MKIIHHGAVQGVTGSCHQLFINANNSILVDCGLFQGDEAGNNDNNPLPIKFEIDTVQALIITHCYIDHVGRLPYLLAAGFNKPIYATTATVALLPMVIEDALKVGVTRNKSLIAGVMTKLKQLLIPIAYGQWFSLSLVNERNGEYPELSADEYAQARVKFKPAGHILGSAYVEIDLGKRPNNHRVVFSGDLGASYTPLLASPKSPYSADTLVIESTYGDKIHQGRRQRSKQLQQVIEKAVSDNGVVLIPAFSIGRTQELLYELENIIYKNQYDNIWKQIEIIVDSPMAANFTKYYQQFKKLWDSEARQKITQQRHPLDFDQLFTIDTHQQHLSVVNYLSNRNKPAIVIAASGMCAGGRIVNYLKQFLSDKSADVIFVGYQAQGTLGRDIQFYGPQGGYVYLDDKRIDIKAGIHSISGYSAHADQKDLLSFVKGIRHKPSSIIIVHGDSEAKQALKNKFRQLLPETNVTIGNNE
ncbi:MBL fold hydrolase [Shewanella sp. NFH-SH190041]|uniref:MBL fold metallo-hydrolase RNA specificity domain-containing protein n=1 Tax=Shewanella sp. NFH-SH190041 TaxID=2950245 RepID=UPI0021C3D57C|nr:MBL fold metallo-hydrolase [Shewanella sp. NFH-SH190041]BDM64202.1 MBL fold hydrolase [Shewanella sp. NFH-SH190041]